MVSSRMVSWASREVVAGAIVDMLQATGPTSTPGAIARLEWKCDLSSVILGWTP